MSQPSPFTAFRPVPAPTGVVDLCPCCGADLRGELIPNEALAAAGPIRYSRQITVKGFRDDSVCWGCPDCHQVWPATGETPPDYLESALARDRAEANTRPRSRLSPLAS